LERAPRGAKESAVLTLVSVVVFVVFMAGLWAWTSFVRHHGRLSKRRDDN
jgi:type II secretory pathway component PulK